MELHGFGALDLLHFLALESSEMGLVYSAEIRLLVGLDGRALYDR